MTLYTRVYTRNRWHPILAECCLKLVRCLLPPGTRPRHLSPLPEQPMLNQQTLQALKSASEEYGLILDTLGRYAVYSAPGVGFSCRRHGDGRPDISTTAAGSRLDAVRAVYGADVARELLPLALAAGGGTGPEVPVEGPLGIKLEVGVAWWGCEGAWAAGR